MSNILLVDDDVKYQEVIKDLLLLEGYQVETASDPLVAIDMCKKNKYDLIISDLIMDTISGLQLVSIVRRINPYLPIMILTGYESDQKEIEGIELDVDDYVYKPISLEVLLKRIERCLRTKKIIKDMAELSSQQDSISVSMKNRRVTKENELVQLTSKEFQLLCFLLKNKNQVFSREEILKHVWSVNDGLIDVRTVDTHIKKIRFKLRISSINTIRGVGYEWFE